MPRSQQPSGICEGDATSLLEGEEGTQDSPAGSSSPSDRERNSQRKLKKEKKNHLQQENTNTFFCTQLQDLQKIEAGEQTEKSGGETGSIRMIKKK